MDKAQLCTCDFNLKPALDPKERHVSVPPVSTLPHRLRLLAAPAGAQCPEPRVPSPPGGHLTGRPPAPAPGGGGGGRGRGGAGGEERGAGAARSLAAAAGLRLGWAGLGRAGRGRAAAERSQSRGAAGRAAGRRAGGRRRRRRARPAALDDGRPVRLRRWRHLLRRLGGRQSPRARHLHRAQGAGRVRRLLVARLRGGGRLHLAQRQHLPGLLGAGQAARAGRGDEGQVDVPRRVVARLQGALRRAAEPQHAGPLRGHLEQRAAGRLRRRDLRRRRWAPAGGAPRAAATAVGGERGRACVGARSAGRARPRSPPGLAPPGRGDSSAHGAPQVPRAAPPGVNGRPGARPRGAPGLSRSPSPG